MAMKKIKLDKQAISEILVADTDLELGAEARDVEEEFFESEDEEYEQLQQQASAQEDRQLSTVCVDAPYHTNFSAAGGTD
jgi:hypothetical protein